MRTHWRRGLALAGLSTLLVAGLPITRSGGPVPQPRLIAPGSVSAGERIPLLAFSYRGCGPVRLRFDEIPIEHQLTRYARSAYPGWTEMFVTVSMPSDATPGRHEIRLYGGCGAEPLDTATVDLGRGGPQN